MPSSSVTSELSFMIPPPDGVRAYQHINVDPATGKRDMNYTREPYSVSIEDFRGRDDILLDTAGFQLYSDKPTSFIKDGQVDVEGYYEESIAAIKELTGATRVQLFDHSMLLSLLACPTRSTDS